MKKLFVFFMVLIFAFGTIALVGCGGGEKKDEKKDAKTTATDKPAEQKPAEQKPAEQKPAEGTTPPAGQPAANPTATPPAPTGK